MLFQRINKLYWEMWDHVWEFYLNILKSCIKNAFKYLK